MCLLQTLGYPKWDEWEPLPYWVDVQADLSLCWSHRSYGRFCRALAYFWFMIRAVASENVSDICAAMTQISLHVRLFWSVLADCLKRRTHWLCTEHLVKTPKRLHRILHKSIAGRYRPVRMPDGPITARCRFIKNASWDGFTYWTESWRTWIGPVQLCLINAIEWRIRFVP